MASFVPSLLPPVPLTSGLRVQLCTPGTRARSTRDTESELLTEQPDQSTSKPGDVSFCPPSILVQHLARAKANANPDTILRVYHRVALFVCLFAAVSAELLTRVAKKVAKEKNV